MSNTSSNDNALISPELLKMLHKYQEDDIPDEHAENFKALFLIVLYLVTMYFLWN